MSAGPHRWRRYVEEEQDRRVPDFDAWPRQGIIASFDNDRVAWRVAGCGVVGDAA